MTARRHIAAAIVVALGVTSATDAQAAGHRGSVLRKIRREFDRRQARCLRSTSAGEALKLMAFVSRYGRRVHLDAKSPAVRACAKFELRFESDVEAVTDPWYHERHHLKATLRLKPEFNTHTTFTLEGAGRLDYVDYEFTNWSTEGDENTTEEGGCSMRDAGATGSRFRVLGAVVDTDKESDAFGGVIRLIFEPGAPRNRYTETCGEDTGSPGSHAHVAETWRGWWANLHAEDLLDPDGSEEGPWNVRLDRSSAGDEPDLGGISWQYDSNQDGLAPAVHEHTTLEIVRVR